MIHEDITISGSFKASGSLVLPRIPSNSLATASTGSLYYDTTADLVKIYTGTGSNEGFEIVGTQVQPASSGGGGGGSSDIDFLVVAGGGGGGFTAGGGGGAGGLRTSSGSTSGGGASAENSITTITSGSTITVIIGAGGAGATGGSSQGTSGGASSIAGTGYTTITSVGGGGGGTRGSGVYSGLEGGSGGGEGGDNSGDGGAGTSGQGFAGGSNSTSGTGGAGGGGAIAVGSAHNGNSGGNGADGLSVSITGTSVAYAGGGGGGGQNAFSAGTGGTGGGGNGGTNAAGGNGTANTGGGGGGDGNLDNNGGAGGSGVVILTYETGSITAAGGLKTSTAAGKFVHTFKSSGTLTVGGPTFSTVAPLDHFNTLLYTGNGANSRSITGVGFKPDWTWIKKRGPSTANHLLQNTVFGAGTMKGLASNDTSTAGNYDQYGYISAFGSNGFTLQEGTDASYSNDNANENNSTYVAWNWKAADHDRSLATINQDGSISSLVSANKAAGFSIVKYTGNQTAGASVGHGLGVAPKMVILKNITRSGFGWLVYHEAISPNAAIVLNSTDAKATDIAFFNNTATTTTTFTLGSDTFGNSNDYPYIGYCFADIASYQKVGSYTGNGNDAGTIVDTGFTPQFVMIKSSSSNDNGGGSWLMYDNARSTSNPRNKRLYADLAEKEATNSQYDLDFLTGATKGFQPKNGDSGGWGYNTLNVEYIYLAIA